MARKDLEADREYKRRWRQENRDRINARTRELRAQDPEKRRERARAERRAAYARDPEKYRAIARANYAKDPEKFRARARQPERYAQTFFRRHGLWPADWARLWEEQGSRCYLCGDELIAEQTHVDHDHSCCPIKYSCPTCRRGLACNNCNAAIGFASDSPERLRRLADALERAKAGVARRRAAAGEQLCLTEEPA